MIPLRHANRFGEGFCPKILMKMCRYAPLIAVMFFVFAQLSSASAETRTLKMYFTHTKESATITFKKDGKYLSSGLKKANRFLRDWRRKEPTKMDPALLDLVWEVYQKSGSRKPVHVISGYRSPRTNKMLRRRGRGVAKNSQHTRGKALDFFLPDVSVAKLRALGLKEHRGGVGYYRGSFVHLDTGRVRHWPRMSSRQLSKVFPRGRTIHVPSNGKPLKGYKVAEANLKRGLNADGTRRNTAVRKSLLAGLFKKGNDGDEGEAPAPTRRPPQLDKSVPVAALLPNAERQRGPDPFSLERTAVSEADAARKRDQDAAAQLAREAADSLANSGTPASANALDRLAVPRKRPSEIALASMQVPLRGGAGDSALEAGLTPARPAVFALAAPQSLQQTIARSGYVPVSVPERAKQLAADQDISKLKARIETALAQGRKLTPAEEAAERQGNSKLEEALKYIPVPSQPDRSRDDAQIALAALSGSGAVRSSVVLSDLRPAIASSANAMVFGSRKSGAPSLLNQPSAETIAAIREQLRVPLPSSNPAGSETGFDRIASSNSSDESELSLGNLASETVKDWAVSSSTRVGSVAMLKAPDYRQGTRRALPASVYSAGFIQAAFPLRADRFSGRAFDRVAFAHFEHGQ